MAPCRIKAPNDRLIHTTIRNRRLIVVVEVVRASSGYFEKVIDHTGPARRRRVPKLPKPFRRVQKLLEDFLRVC